MRPASDVLSLTLPSLSRSKAKRRERKPKGPGWWWWLFWVVYCGGTSLWTFIEGQPILGGLSLLPMALYWTAWQRTRRGVVPAWPLAPLPTLIAMGLYVAAVLSYNALGVKAL